MITKKEILNVEVNIFDSFFQSYPLYKKDIWESEELLQDHLVGRKPIKYRRKIDFTNHKNEYIKTQIKYFYGKSLVENMYTITTVFEAKSFDIKKVLQFIDIHYPNIKSILDVSKEELIEVYMNYLTERGIKTHKIKNGNKVVNDPLIVMNTFYNYIYDLLDDTLEIDKDIWDGTKLPIEINYTSTQSKKLKFTKVNMKFRGLVKKYFKTRLLELKNLTFSISMRYLHELSIFLNYLDEYYPELDIKHINRHHIVGYLDFLRNKKIIDKVNKKTKQATNVYISTNLTVIRKFLTDLKIFEWPEAPKKHIENLFLPNDNPHRRKSEIFKEPKYIPDYIWEQVVDNINLMNAEYIPIILIMEGSGFRGTDVLGLKIDCLDQDNQGDYWLVGDQRKVNYKDHKVPISEELAKVILSQQEITKEKSNSDNNPDNYLFVSYRGPRKGKPKTTSTLSRVLNDFSKKAKVRDSNGNIYRFNNHGFRHRYGVTMINNGMNIVHLQRLMAHASPEMTMVYAKIHDKKLKEAYFKSREKSGIKFTSNGEIVKVNIEDQALENEFELEWIRHNYDSIRMDHGMCIKSVKMNCDYADKVLEPPCIANNCRSFHVDGTFIDYYKNQILSLKKDIEVYEKQNHIRSLEFANKKLANYTKILNELTEKGSINGLSKERREYIGKERVERG